MGYLYDPCAPCCDDQVDVCGDLTEDEIPELAAAICEHCAETADGWRLKPISIIQPVPDFCTEITLASCRPAFRGIDCEWTTPFPNCDDAFWRLTVSGLEPGNVVLELIDVPDAALRFENDSDWRCDNINQMRVTVSNLPEPSDPDGDGPLPVPVVGPDVGDLYCLEPVDFCSCTNKIPVAWDLLIDNIAGGGNCPQAGVYRVGPSVQGGCHWFGDGFTIAREGNRLVLFAGQTQQGTGLIYKTEFPGPVDCDVPVTFHRFFLTGNCTTDPAQLTATPIF